MPFPDPLSITKYFTSPDEIAKITKYVKNQTKFLREKTEMLRTNLLPEWIRLYKGTPEVDRKTFPWPEASNLVIQLAATHADELLARVMAIYNSDQLWTASILSDWDEGDGEDERELLEKFLSDMAFDPEELDLYRVQETWFGSTIKYGTGIIKFPWEIIEEEMYLGTADAGNPFRTIVRRDGPRPENVPLNKFLINPACVNLANADFIGHIITWTREQLRERATSTKYAQTYDQKALQEILDSSPDRSGPSEVQEAQEASKGMSGTQGEASEEFDLDECWFVWHQGDKAYRMVVYWHNRTQKFCGGIFNNYPKNEAPFEDAKLAYDDDQYYGYGFMEMLRAYQQFVSMDHNQRVDNRNLANTGALRVPANSPLLSVLKVYPGVVFPGGKDEIEAIKLGDTSGFSTEDEQLTLALAKERTGIDPAVGGAGGGIVNAKRGIYSAQGTAIANQLSNNRNNLRMSDMRSSHTRFGRKALQMYANFGITRQIKAYGDNSEKIISALKHYKDGKLGLIVRPASASNNKELEKQNDLLLMQNLERIQGADIQSMMALEQPGFPEQAKEYVIKCIIAKNALMRKIFRAFDHTDIERMTPLPEFIKQMREQARNAQSGDNAGGVQQQQGQSPIDSTRINGQAQQAQGAIPVGSGASPNQLPQSPAQRVN